MKIIRWPILQLLLAKLMLFAFFWAADSSETQAQRGKILLALSKGDHMLAVVDPVNLKVIAHIPVGIDPHEVIASGDGKTAYVTIYGGGNLHEINVIDLVGQKSLANVDTRPFFGPHGIVFVNGKMWFSAEGSKSVASYDPATAKLDWSMGTGEGRTHMIYVTPDTKKIYTTNMSSGTISILEGATVSANSTGVGSTGHRQEWNHTVVPVVPGSEGFDVLADGSELWTASSDGTICIVDLQAKKLAEKINAKVVGANRLKFTPDNKRAFISSLKTGELTIYDVKSRKEIKRLKLGRGAAGILMDADGSRAFVACSADNYVAVVDLSTLEVTKRFNVGTVPDGLAWAMTP